MEVAYILKSHLVMKLRICSFILLYFSFVHISAQSDDIGKLKSEHAKYISEINRANKLLVSKKKSKNNTLNQLELLNSKLSIQNQLLLSYKEEISLLNDEVNRNLLLLNDLNDDIKSLKKNYSNLIIEANKFSTSNYNEFMLLFSSSSFSEAYRRFQLLRQYSSYRKKQGIVLNESIIKHDSILQVQENILNSKQSVYDSLFNQSRNIEKSISSKKLMIAKLNTDERWLKQNIKNNTKKSKSLQKEIEKLISREANKSATFDPSDFYKFKGKLPWPVSNGIVTSYFGEHNHPSLKGVKVKNNGIDITTTKDNDVKSIFDGKVSRVIAIPGYNKAVIVRHGKYLTVYANLKDVSVKNGQILAKNQKIGRIFTSSTDNNAILHFEVWEGSKKINPLIWLGKSIN